jgi:fatty-acyl-CoA synthase
MTSPYDRDLERNAANYTPLNPVSLLAHTARVFPDRVAVVHGARRFTWREHYARCRRLASALARRGIGRGDTIAALLANTPEMLEMHYGPAMIGAVLNAINTRLDAAAIAFILDHGDAKVVFVDTECQVTRHALRLCKVKPLVIDVADPEFTGGERIGDEEYEAFIAGGDPEFRWRHPPDEWDAIALSYTSGTTGNPKGVVTHYRGAYLNAIANILSWSMPRHPTYLWTLPMFHCNGWCFPWTVAAQAGVHVCLRRVEARHIFDLIREHRVTHYCGAPIVHNMLINAPAEWRAGIGHRVHCLVAGAPPPAAVIEGMARLGFDMTHVYGLTEVYGPAAVCMKQEGWEDLPLEERVRLNGRQGVSYLLQEDMAVLDSDTLEPVPADGETVGEIMFRGNITMKSYLRNPAATTAAFRGGWFHSGDLAVLHPDGYAKIKDRAKDIIISGGENISSQEVEDALSRHPAVLLSAVVAQPDPKWGESPCAFVELKEGAHATEADIITFCRAHMAHFKVPKKVVFCTLPKTSTGKIQKFVLRQQAKSSDAIQ